MKFFITITKPFKDFYRHLFYFFIRVKWRNVLNDLKLHREEKYIPLGVFPTFPSKQPPNYTKKIRALHLNDSFLPTKTYTDKSGDTKIACNPVAIVNYGLFEYGLYLNDKSEKRLLIIKAVSDWLVSNQMENGCWIENFDYYCHNVSVWLNDGWISGMCQGEAIALLCRCYSLTNEPKYLIAAKAALQCFERDISNCGVLSSFNGIAVYEEYPTSPGVHVLNGFIYSLFGLYDLWASYGDTKAGELFKKGVDSVKRLLPYYDDSRISHYDLGHITASPRKININYKYHILHIKLLKNLYSVTNEETFLFFAEKWEKFNKR